MTGKHPTDPSGTADASRSADAGGEVSAGADDLTPRGEPPSFSPSEWLADRFQIERLLGRGSMGEVYAVRDDELAITVALKTLPTSLSQDQEAVLRLKREVLLARSVAHPHVCRVFDVGRHGEGADAVWFLTMELLRGETLRERLQRRGRLAPEEALPLAQQMAAGLGAAHRAGVVHRDFKSDNVMIVAETGGERAVVMDFGVARAARPARPARPAGDTTLTGSGVLVGTPAYMAPEQIRGEEAGPAADIFALGVVLYELLTGKLPFTGANSMEAAARRLFETPVSPRRVVPELDERWEAVILRCLALEPAERFARAEEVAESLAGRTPVPHAGVSAPPRRHHTLPVERDTFTGRQVALDELERKLAQYPLVTLLGAAGMGKTRLAVRFGWRTLERWPGGVWFCDATDARSRDGVASAVASSLGVPLGKGDPIEHLGHAIASRGECLVILDNLEQVVEHATEMLARWLERAREAHFMATSRERLNLPGEEVFAVEPLELDQGVELFIDRTRKRAPGFGAEGHELESIREVIRMLDGMPLAIELAAARVRTITAKELAERMRGRFRLLTGGAAGRHATLHEAIGSSWEPLRPWEKAAWAQSSVFEGGFTLDVAEAVLDLARWSDAPWMVDVIQSLVDKSLLRTWVVHGATGDVVLEQRFGMYVSLQEYARARLSEEGAIPGASGLEASRAAEERHGRWVRSLGRDEAIEALGGPEGAARRRALPLELENLIAACRRAVPRGDGETAAAAYRVMWEVLEAQGPLGVAVKMGEDVLSLPLGREERARTLMTLGFAEWRSGRAREARNHLEAGLAAHRELGNRRLEGFVLGALGSFHLEQGRNEEARAHLEAALTVHREVGNRRLEGTVFGNLGNLCRDQGRMDEARAHLEAALAINREVGDRRSEGMTLGNLGLVYRQRGQEEKARQYLEAALAIHRELEARRSEAIVLGNLANLHLERGRIEEARRQYEAALAIMRDVGDRRAEGVILNNLGNLQRGEELVEEARTLYEAALAIHREVGNRRFEGIAIGNLGRVHLARGRIAEARDALDRAESILREVEDRLELGMLLCVRAALEYRDGRASAARAALREVEALAAEAGVGPDSELGRELAGLHRMLAVAHER